MTFKLTGHAEIDHQHAILDGMVARFERVCASGKPDACCRTCITAERRACTDLLAQLTDDMMTFLVGHVTYEEKLMELLPDIPRCRVHVEAHKDAHADISERLSELALQIGTEAPEVLGTRLYRIVSDWIGNHTSQFDASLAVQLEGLGAAEIEFDAELVAILDEFVFRYRPTSVASLARLPTRPDAGRSAIQARFESLTPRQREVCRLVVGGMANKEIAKQLGTTINTVKTHRAEIFRKMKVSSLLELVRSLGKFPI